MITNQKYTIIGLAIFSAFYFFACVTNPITYRYDKDKDEPMHEHTTFKLVKPDEEALKQMDIRNPDEIPLLEETIRGEMLKRNYKESDDPDLWVTYFVTGKDFQKAQSSSVSVGVGFGGYMGGVGVSQGKTNVKYFDCVEGSLVIDFYNKEHKLVWHGLAKGTYEVDKTDIDALTVQVVKRIFQYYKYKVKVPKEKKP